MSVVHGIGPDSCNAARAIGYRQALDLVCSGRLSQADDDEAIELLRATTAEMQTASRRLVTRQLTWFRDNELFKWVEADTGGEQVVETILAELAKPRHEGGSGDYGRLTRKEQQQIKRYVPEFKILNCRDLCLRVLDSIR
uniref:tRNA dimethylallyltransferase n=1 Tax=Tetraselmis sp. GSL018 TaxID=582737 RepID=A0A061RG61_9CHLO